MNDPAPLTVTQLTRRIKGLVETRFPSVWVQGEISNCTRAGSGHVYMTLKDETAQIRAVLWRSTAARVRFELHNGLEVVAAGPLEVYEARGSYQLVVQQLVPRGLGALELAFRQLYEKLAAEGLFAPERKRPLPAFPRRIALVTSPSGAAVRDMLQVIARRWRGSDVVILPVAVQGERAAPEIAAALGGVHRLPGVDLVITGRGGGSLEDLWAFNEEMVARAIAACPLPVISAVGHEVDVSIADLVADRRALTPSEAAEIAVPDRREVLGELHGLWDRVNTALHERASRARLQLDGLATRPVLARPRTWLHDRAALVDELAEDLGRAASTRLERERQRLAALAASLDALSPLDVLKRGYSITQAGETGPVVHDAAQLRPGDTLVTRFGRGRAASRVDSVEPGPTESIRSASTSE